MARAKKGSGYLDAEILLVEEGLAVGDAAFQQKCLVHLFALQRSGVTILLVSHDLNAGQRLCHRVLWFDHGRVRMEGAPAGVVQAYLDHVHRRDERSLAMPNQQAAIPRWEAVVCRLSAFISRIRPGWNAICLKPVKRCTSICVIEP